MIEQVTLLWLGTMALLVDYVGLSRASDGKSQAVALALGFLLWAGFTMASLGYTITANATVYTRESQLLAVIGLFGAAMSIVLLFEAAFRAVGDSAP
jgi:hypothetical protein